MRYILSPLSKSGEGVGGGVTLYLITSVSAVISPITNYQLPITHYQLPITHYPLPITHYPLPITHYPLPITNYPLPNTVILPQEYLPVKLFERVDDFLLDPKLVTVNLQLPLQ
ncbi:MAG: hypothetical protein ACKPCG_21285 [Dolichospermum sp.]